MNEITTQKQYLSSSEAAAYLGLSKQTLFRWHKNKTLVPALVIGATRYRRYSKEQLDAYLDNAGKEAGMQRPPAVPSPLDRLKNLSL